MIAYLDNFAWSKKVYKTMFNPTKQKLIEFYSGLYERLNDITPLQIDCGELCGSRCCSREVGEGIFLFPGEAVMFENKSYWGNIKKIKGMDAVVCDGYCPRDERPLVCRLFPLFPYISKEGELELRFYSPMSLYCPLIQLNDYSFFDPDYFDEVQEIAEILSSNPACNDFIRKISCQIDAFESQPWTKLFSKERHNDS